MDNDGLNDIGYALATAWEHMLCVREGSCKVNEWSEHGLGETAPCPPKIV